MANQAPQYVRRVARLPEVFSILATRPEGMRLADLAARLGIPATELRADLLAFFTADLGGLLGLSRPSVLEFLGPEGGDADPNDAEIVRLVDERPSDELGVEYVDAATLGLVYSAATALAEVDPDDEHLQGALAVLAETIAGAEIERADDRPATQGLEALQDAARDRRRVRITYSRAWNEGVIDRVVDPYRLVQTRRGWEIDAGPPDDDGNLRTYLHSNLRSFDVLAETFEPPADLESRLAAQRATTTVRVRVPHEARWAADEYAERVSVVTDDETEATLDLDLLPPVDRRVGLLLLAAGPDASVVDPPGMVAALTQVARELLRHHRAS